MINQHNIRFVAFLAGLLFILLFSSVANAQTPVLVRAWEQPAKAQVSFDWPKQVNYEAQLSGQKITVKFSEPLIANIAPIGRLAPSYISGGRITEDGKNVVIILKRNVEILAFNRSNRVILELYAADEASNSNLATDGGGTTSENVNEEDDGFQSVNSEPQSFELEEEFIEQTNSLRPSSPGFEPVENNQQAQSNRIEPSRIPIAEQAAPVISPLDRLKRTKRDQEGNVFYQVDVMVDQDQDGVTDLIFDWPVRVSFDAVNRQGNLDLSFSAGAEIDREELKQKLPDWLRAPVITSESSKTSILFNMTRHHEIETKSQSARIIIRLLPPEISLARKTKRGTRQYSQTEIEAARAVLAGTLDTKFMTKDQAREILVAAEGKDANLLSNEESETDKPENVIGPTLVNMRFDWPTTVGGAVFRRGEYIWLVFDDSTPMDMEPLGGINQDVIIDIEQMPIEQKTLFRLHVPDTRINPSLKREGGLWQVDLRLGPIMPASQLPIDISVNADLGSHMFLASQEPGEHISVIDPVTGDELNIITFREAGLGVNGLRRYPEFNLLPSAQGLAIETLTDRMVFTKAEDGFRISAPNGLQLSGVSPENATESNISFKTANLFDFKEWALGPAEDFYTNKQRLLNNITEMSKADIARARLYLARFYVAHDLGQEALGVLDLIERDHPKLIESVPVRALRGVANFMAGRLDEAEQDLGDREVGQYREGILWNAALLAERGNSARALEYFRLAVNQLRNYPQPLKGKLGIMAIEAAMENRDVRMATAIIDQLDREKDLLPRGVLGDLQYNKGRMVASRSDYALANQYWQELMAGNDRKNAARAAFAYVGLNLRQETISNQEALEILEQLRYQWRGNEFELAVLDQLGKLYINNGLYFEGFDVYKTALSYFPDNPMVEVIGNRMQSTFRDLFLNRKANEMPAAQALAFFDAYRELTPPDEEGDQMINYLSQRLIQVDLLDHAATLLDYQIDHRLEGEERIETGTKLALVRLLESKPDKTLEALDKTEDITSQGALYDDRRRLRAQAQFELNRPEEALKLLAGDISDEANLLRRDIYWKNRQWGEVAKNLQRLAGKPPQRARQSLPEERAQYVVDWAVALKLDNDRRGLDYLREVYGPSMSRTEIADVFDYLTSRDFAPRDLQQKAEIEDYVQKLTARSSFEDFMKTYRERVL